MAKTGRRVMIGIELPTKLDAEYFETDIDSLVAKLQAIKENVLKECPDATDIGLSEKREPWSDAPSEYAIRYRRMETLSEMRARVAKHEAFISKRKKQAREKLEKAKREVERLENGTD